MSHYIQDPPNTLKIELTEGCNLACTFCGINSIREHPGGPYKFLSRTTAKKIAKAVAEEGWKPRIELAMHGEPTQNPKRVDIIRILRHYLPHSQIMMTSNGGGLLRDCTRDIEAMFDAGLNILALDDYQNVKIVPKIRERYQGKIPLIDYPASLKHSPYNRYPEGTKLLIIMLDISIPQPGVHNKLDNMGGCAAPKDFSANGKRCARPFREIVFRWDGTVSICCDDWQGRYVIGNIHQMSLPEIWQHPRFMAARKKLFKGERDFGPCHGCSAISYRVGLLPDRNGRQHLPHFTQEDKQHIRDAVRNDLVQLTPRIARSWDTKQA